MSLHLLEELGFEHAATWSLDQDLLSIAYQNYRDTRNVLYAFVSNGIVRYVGVTEQSLSNRMQGYRLPGSGQRTNIRVNEQIRLLLNARAPVDVYCLGEVEVIFFREIRINVPAGIEIGLINIIAEYHAENELPRLWNKRGNVQPDAIVDQGAIEEDIAENLIYLNAARDEIQAMGVYTDITVKLGKTYYYGPFFNPKKIGSALLGRNGDPITIDCLGPNPLCIVSSIDRTTNGDGTVRLYLGNLYKEWVQANYTIGDMMTVRILNPNHIQLCSRS